MSSAAVLAVVVPLAFASGINVYATVAVIGLVARLGGVPMPAQFAPFGDELVIGVALLLYAVEFVADKVPWIDSVWDAVHTFVRPLGGAIVALLAAGGAPVDVQVIAALLGGSVALTTHLAKAGTRAVANTSPEPFTNWTLSVLEDVLVVGLTWLAIAHPFVAATVAGLLLAVIVLSARLLLRALRSRARRGASGAHGPSQFRG